MTQTAPLPTAPVVTAWQTCPGLRAGAIDSAASLIVMEVLVDALSRLPQGRRALDEALSRRTAMAPGADVGATATEIAAGALALALVEAARTLAGADPAAA